MIMLTKLSPGQLLTIPGHLYVYKYDWSDYYHINWAENKPEAGPDTIYIEPFTLSYTLPADFNEVRSRIEGIDAAKAVLYAAFRQKDEELTEKKEKLISLSWNPNPTLNVAGA